MSDEDELAWLAEGRLRPVRGTAPGRDDHKHHLGFDEALNNAIDEYARMRGGDEGVGPTAGQKLAVTLSVVVSVTNPGRIELYVADLG